jgi:hypothetical protein
MAASLTANWYQYSQWTKNIARNSRITEPTGPLLDFIKVFLKVICDPVTQTGTRTWLIPKFQRLAVNSGYQGNIDTEQTHVLVRMLEVVGRDFKKIPITDFESYGVALLINLAQNRQIGSGPYYGGVIGDGAAPDIQLLPT